MKESATIIEPGFYQMNMGGASLAECWRLSTNPIQFIISLTWKLLHKKLENYTWLPASESIKYCDFDQFLKPLEDELWLSRINRRLCVKVPADIEAKLLAGEIL